MRLYSMVGATGVDDPEYGHIAPADDGGFDLPDDLSDRLVRFHDRGVKQWETELERQARLHLSEQARMRDPATLFDAIERLIAATTASQPTPEPAPARGKRAAAKTD